uniref:UDP-glycosyltransferases domain-containing protein n=1 Tax=Picea sitchensis TaxID=3332 RepID=D5AAL5_PICSI|nr:unknown [Picea sitchensis]
MSPTDLPSFLQATEMSDFMLHVIFLSFQSVREAGWVLTNSVYELETEAIQYSMQTTTPLCSVGPLLPSGYFDNHQALDSDFATWLDSNPRHSVIYVSFGDCARVSQSQIEEIAIGLLESRISFFWALPPETVKSDATLSEILPDGFLDQIKGKGVVVSSWSRHHHLALLSHRSIGGFFTPCDWNSILQSLCIGVPLLGFPLHADQYTNCMLVSDEMGIAMKVRHSGIEGETIGSKEIARNVKALMRGEGGKRARKNMKRLRRIATKATIEGGSSARNLDNFVEELVDKILFSESKV